MSLLFLDCLFGALLITNAESGWYFPSRSFLLGLEHYAVEKRSTAMRKQEKQAAWINLFILIGAGFFIFALFLSAVFDEKIRVLHALQALIYVAVIVLTRRQSCWGYGAGFFIAALWNYTNLFVTTFFEAGMRQLMILLQTGRLPRPDLLIAVVAVAGHFLMIIACLAGFLRGRRNWWQFAGGGVAAVGYFIAIIYWTGPQYIGLLKRVFHW